MKPLAPLPSDLPPVERAARLPRGFEALGTRAGIKRSGGLDLAVVLVQDGPAAAAATFTTNRLPAAPVQMNRAHLAATAPDGRGTILHQHDGEVGSTRCLDAGSGAEGLEATRQPGRPLGLGQVRGQRFERPHGTMGSCSRPLVSGRPKTMLKACTACPAAPFTRLSSTEMVVTRPVRSS